MVSLSFKSKTNPNRHRKMAPAIQTYNSQFVQMNTDSGLAVIMQVSSYNGILADILRTFETCGVEVKCVESQRGPGNQLQLTVQLITSALEIDVGLHLSKSLRHFGTVSVAFPEGLNLRSG